MPVNIDQIYHRYQIPPNLIWHMTVAAAIGQVISASWLPTATPDHNSPANHQDLIVNYLLIHDLGNIIKFNFASQLSQQTFVIHSQQFHWQQVQQTYQAKYGFEAEAANLAIAKELAAPPIMLDMCGQHSFTAIDQLIADQDWPMLICLYADLRVAPSGLTSLADRLADLQNRYQNRDQSWTSTSTVNARSALCGKLESLLNTHTQLNLLNLQRADFVAAKKMINDWQWPYCD